MQWLDIYGYIFPNFSHIAQIRVMGWVQIAVWPQAIPFFVVNHINAFKYCREILPTLLSVLFQKPGTNFSHSMWHLHPLVKSYSLMRTDNGKGTMMANFLEKKFLMLLKTMNQGTVFHCLVLKVMMHIKILCHAQGCHTLENKSIHCFSAFHRSLIVVLQFTKKESESFSQSQG